MLLTTYKEHDIAVSEYGRFTADGIKNNFDTLDEIKLEIDKETKIKYKPIDGILIGGGGYLDRQASITEVKITRPHGHPSRKEFWYSKIATKERGTTSSVYPDTPYNRNVAEQYIDLKKQANALREKADKVLSTLDNNIVLEVC